MKDIHVLIFDYFVVLAVVFCLFRMADCTEKSVKTRYKTIEVLESKNGN